MIHRCLLACLFTHLAVVAQAATPADYAEVYPIETSGNSAAWQLDLDGSVYAVSGGRNLRDLAVFNADGHAVPMIIQPFKYPDVSVEQRSAVPVLPLPKRKADSADSDFHLLVERDAEGRLRRLETQVSGNPAANPETNQWLIDLGEFESGIDELALDWDTPKTGVIARFEVAGSNDLQSWNVLDADATLVVLEQDGARIERRVIALSPTRTRYLRLRRSDDGAPLLGLRAVASHVRFVSRVPPAPWIEVDAVESIGDMQASATRHLYLLRYPVPASALWIGLSNDNAIAQLEIATASDVADAPMRWIHRSRLVAFRLLQNDDVIESEAISLDPVTRVSAVRIDSVTPLATHPHLLVGYRPPRLVFLAEGKGPFLLAVGSATAQTPDYPIEAALVTLRAKLGQQWQPPLAQLGEVRESAGEKAYLTPRPPIEWKHWLLWAVLIGAALVVGGIALSLLRDPDKRGAEDRQQPPEE